MNKTSAQVAAGGTLTLTAIVSPDDATEKTVSWEVSPESAATLSATTGNSVTVSVKSGTAVGSSVTINVSLKAKYLELNFVADPVIA